MGRILGTDPAPDVLDEIHSRSDGHPFFPEELLAVLRQPGQRRVPSGLADALTARFATLSDVTVRILEAASVGGSRVEQEQILAAAGLPDADVEAAVQEALGASILTMEGGSIAFRHSLTREAVYEGQLPSTRRRIHARYAETLAPSEGSRGADRARRLALVAYHWDAAGRAPQALSATSRSRSHSAASPGRSTARSPPAIATHTRTLGEGF